MSQTDNWTQKTSGLTVTGFGEEGASVQMYNGSAVIQGASGLVSSGKFSIIISLPKGTYAIKARQTDPAGNISAFSEYLNLKVDTTPPKAPKVETSGKNPTSDDTPAWRWASGGEGMGRYRYKLNSSDLNNETEETINTGYTPETSLAEGKHTLYVQECDEAGNWSESGTFEIEVKKAAPDVPKVSGTTPTSDTTPLWTWTSGEAGGTGLFRYKMDDDDLDNGATETAKTSFSPASVLSQGSHTLYVQEKNSADIWSESGSFTIEVDSGKPCSQAASPQAVNPAQNPFIITYTADDVYEGEVCGEAASSGSGLEKAELYVKMHGETEYLLADTDIGNSIDGEFAYTAEKEGMYYFYTRVTDKAGNTENIPEIGYDTMTVYVSEFSGYAIIAVGSVATKDGLKDHTLAANNIYSHLIRRGFALVEEDRETDPLDYIKYFNPSGELQPGEDDYEANKIDYTWALQDALTKWAPEKMKAIPGPLFIILIDHGSPDKFYLTEGQEVTAGTFKIWLDILQNKLDAEGIDQPVIIILGACYSGSFIDDLSDPDRNRIIIASSAENEPSYQGPLDPYSGNRDGEFFTSVLFNGLGAGYDLKTAFEIAVEQTEEHTFSGEEGVPGPWFDGAKQHPLLDDNGDGQGINSFSPGKDGADQKEDGAKSLEIVMGRGESKSLMLTGAGTIPVTPPALDFSVSQATLWAKAADTEDTEVWAEIRKPDMVLKQEGVNQQIVDLKTAKLEWIPEKECYEGVYKSFTDPGKYTIFFYAREKTAGIISPFKKFYLYKADDPNAESPDNDAVSPDDDAISQDDDTVSGADDTGDDTLSPDDDNPSLKTGDADGDGDIDLADAVLALKISCGNDPGDVITAGADANDDGKIGPQEAVYILRKLAGI
jgi:hypothetical protein